MENISRSIAASEKIFNGLLMCGLIVKIGSLLELVGMVITAECEEVLGNVVKVLKFGDGMLWLDNREIDDGGGIFKYQDAVVESSVGRGVCKEGPQYAMALFATDVWLAKSSKNNEGNELPMDDTPFVHGTGTKPPGP